MDSGRRVLSAALSQKQWCWRVRAHGLARGLSMRRADMNRAGEPVPQEASAGESVPRPFRSAFQSGASQPLRLCSTQLPRDDRPISNQTEPFGTVR